MRPRTTKSARYCMARERRDGELRAEQAGVAADERERGATASSPHPPNAENRRRPARQTPSAASAKNAT